MIDTENSSFLGHGVVYIGIWVPTLGYPNWTKSISPKL